MNCSNPGIRMVLLGAAFVLVGCGPTISHFELTALPRTSDNGAISSVGVVRICAGDRVAARWRVRGEPVMVLGSGASVERPEATIREPDTLEVTLVVNPGPREELRTYLVLEYPATAPDALGFQTREVRGDTVIAGGKKNADARFAIQQVTNSSDRTIEIRHANIQEILAVGGTTSKFDGTPSGGPWELRRILTEAELANPQLRPTSLRVDLTVRCKSEAV